jgi:hypothetical protein
MTKNGLHGIGFVGTAHNIIRTLLKIPFLDRNIQTHELTHSIKAITQFFGGDAKQCCWCSLQ